MGYFWDGTRLYCYDDDDTSGGHAGGGAAHTMAGFNSFDATRCPLSLGKYEPTVDIMNGHPTTGNTNLTTFSMTKEVVEFNGVNKRFNTGSAGNYSAIKWLLGTKRGTGDGAGGIGPTVVTTSTPIIRGYDIRIYGGLYTTTAGAGTAVFAPSQDLGDGFNPNEICGASFRYPGMTFFLTANWQRIVNCHFEGVSGATAITNMAAYDSFGNKFTPPSGWNSITTTNTPNLRWKDFKILASESPGLYEFSSVANGWWFVNPGWAELTTPQAHLNAPSGGGAFWMEYWYFQVNVIDTAGAPIANVPVVMYDGSGTQIEDEVLTDAKGQITFGDDWVAENTLAGNHIYVQKWEGTSATYKGPWRVVFNSGARKIYNKPTKEITFDWPYTGADRISGQLQKVNMFMVLDDPSLPFTPVPSSADVERFEVSVP